MVFKGIFPQTIGLSNTLILFRNACLFRNGLPFIKFHRFFSVAMVDNFSKRKQQQPIK